MLAAPKPYRPTLPLATTAFGRPCSRSAVQGWFLVNPVHRSLSSGGNATAQKKPMVQRPGVESFQVSLQPRSGGWPLPRDVQAKMEEALGASFSDVRIHVGSEAASIGALAFTWGPEIHFALGQYNPHTQHGQFLLGH